MPVEPQSKFWTEEKAREEGRLGRRGSEHNGAGSEGDAYFIVILFFIASFVPSNKCELPE